jgi:hypothetical protein
VQVGNYSRFSAVPSLRGSFFRLDESAHRACGVGPSVGMRDGNANKFQSTPCVIQNRHFPPPWAVEGLDACFVVRDANGQGCDVFVTLKFFLSGQELTTIQPARGGDINDAVLPPASGSLESSKCDACRNDRPVGCLSDL